MQHVAVCYILLLVVASVGNKNSETVVYIANSGKQEQKCLSVEGVERGENCEFFFIKVICLEWRMERD